MTRTHQERPSVSSAVRRTSLFICLFLGPALAACGSTDTGSDTERSSTSALIGADASDPSQDFVPRINLPSGSFCSGTLVAPTLVMTAQHCFVDNGALVGGTTENSYVGCTLGTNPVAPSSITVGFGSDQSAPAKTITASKLFVDVNNTRCDHDIAFVELSEPVTAYPFRPLLLDSPVVVGTSIMDVGWGDVSDNMGGYTQPRFRQAETGTVLLSASPTGQGGTVMTPDGQNVSLPAGYVAASVRGCNGDSGSPLLDQMSLALLAVSVGIVSDKVTMVDGAPQSDCSDAVTVAVPLSTNVAFIESAFQEEKLMPWRVGQGAPPADIGGSCTVNNQCNSNFCVTLGTSDNATGYCSRPCTTDVDCSNGTSCLATGAKMGDGGADAGAGAAPASVCLPPQPGPSTRGCSVGAAPGVGSKNDVPDWSLWAVGGVIAATLRRKRSTRRGGGRQS